MKTISLNDIFKFSIRAIDVQSSNIQSALFGRVDGPSGEQEQGVGAGGQE